MSVLRVPSRCPCGSGEAYTACCGPLHLGRGSGRVTAPTAERLMRSRYSAFAVGHVVYLLASWHPSTRPEVVRLDPELDWRRLEVLGTTGGGEDDEEGTVRFVAHFWHAGERERGTVEEDSAFVREDGQWTYLGPVS